MWDGYSSLNACCIETINQRENQVFKVKIFSCLWLKLHGYTMSFPQVKFNWCVPSLSYSQQKCWHCSDKERLLTLLVSLHKACCVSAKLRPAISTIDVNLWHLGVAKILSPGRAQQCGSVLELQFDLFKNKQKHWMRPSTGFGWPEFPWSSASVGRAWSHWRWWAQRNGQDIAWTWSAALPQEKVGYKDLFGSQWGVLLLPCNTRWPSKACPTCACRAWLVSLHRLSQSLGPQGKYRTFPLWNLLGCLLGCRADFLDDWGSGSPR